MWSKASRFILTGAFLAAVGLVTTCAPVEDGGVDQAAREAEWAQLQQDQQDLMTRRGELKELRAKIAMGHEALSEEEVGEMSPEEAHLKLTEKATQMESEIASAADTLNTRLVDFINADPMVEGEEPSEMQLGAIRMKTDEDVDVAMEYIEKGGDYRKALDILESALRADPDNEKLKAQIEKTQAERYMTEERFASVEKGMGQDEVRSLLGQVLHHNVRDYEDQGVQAWFYVKEGGAAAAVFFRKSQGEWKVYRTDFNAVERKVVEPE